MNWCKFGSKHTKYKIIKLRVEGNQLMVLGKDDINQGYMSNGEFNIQSTLNHAW